MHTSIFYQTLRLTKNDTLYDIYKMVTDLCQVASTCCGYEGANVKHVIVREQQAPDDAFIMEQGIKWEMKAVELREQ